jgi:monoamine oxidase
MHEADVVVLGAGAAGLAAARVLSLAGATAIVLEARDRIGGRILTREDPGLQVPVDLGGEFIHGTPEITFALMRDANTVAIDTAGTALRYDDGKLREREDPFEIVARVMQRASELRDDVSIDEFTRDFPDEERRYTRMMVEGFDAADPARASTLALAEEWADDESGQTSRQFRPLGGYAHLLRTLLGSLDPARVQVLLASPAHALRRTREGVEIDAVASTGAPVMVRARTAIVTLPAGVLQEGTLRFEPPLPQPKLDALHAIVMGPVVKLALRFRRAFWETVRDERYRDAAFFHRPESSFPTFWTLLPLRAPLLVAWAGGPKADALASFSESARISSALDDLRVLFGAESDPHGELEAAYTHDWQADPYSRGAYSYVAVGGRDARAVLAAPHDGAIFFAGEATSPSSEAGTVAGALQSGERAAKETLAVIGREGT